MCVISQDILIASKQKLKLYQNSHPHANNTEREQKSSMLEERLQQTSIDGLQPYSPNICKLNQQRTQCNSKTKATKMGT